MKANLYDQLQIREVFHLEFLRCMSRKIKAVCYALKGGANLRFFFNSIRYSEDMDLDIKNIEVFKLRDIVIQILQSVSFKNVLMPFGISEIILPNMTAAKQTETTQRFKIHLITSNGEDLFTKIEFSRRSNKGKVIVHAVSDAVTRAYRISPLLVPHYDIQSAIMQKINALASRPLVQARDIFDIYVLSSQYSDSIKGVRELICNDKVSKAYENIFKIGFSEFRDTVVFYLPAEDRDIYGNASSWEEIRLKTANFIGQLRQ